MAVSHTTIRVNLKENVTVDAISEIVSIIGGRYGCRTCGLMGVDLHLSGDPGDLAQVRELAGVHSVSLE
jgi:hypothetical protein